MTNNNSGPETSTAVVEGGARKSDQLGSSITSENKVSADAIKFLFGLRTAKDDGDSS